MNQEISIKGSLKSGWDLTKRHYPLILAYLGTFLALGVVRYLIENALASMALKVLLGLAFQVLNWYLTFNALGVSLRLVDGQEAGYAELWKARGNFLFYILATILYGLISVGGIFLLVVPGIIWGLMFMFYGYAMIEKPLDPLAALKESKRLTQGVKMPLFLFSLAVLGLNLLGLLLAGLGLFVTMPVTYFAIVFLYRQRTMALGAPAAA